ncbi:MAG: hypothetical protein ACTS3R_16640 [Inquilinaceae bacterium]
MTSSVQKFRFRSPFKNRYLGLTLVIALAIGLFAGGAASANEAGNTALQAMWPALSDEALSRAQGTGAGTVPLLRPDGLEEVAIILFDDLKSRVPVTVGGIGPGAGNAQSSIGSSTLH